MSETMMSEKEFANFAYRVTECLKQKRSKPKKQQHFFTNILKKLDKWLFEAEMQLLHFAKRLICFLVISAVKSPIYFVRTIVFTYRNWPTRKEFLMEVAMISWQLPFLAGFLAFCFLANNPDTGMEDLKGYALNNLMGIPYQVPQEIEIEVSPYERSLDELEELRQPGGEIYELARAMYGETVGDGVIAQLSTAGSVFERLDRPDFPNTILGVLYQPYSNGWGCQYNSVCDDRVEDMDSEMGQRILDLATMAWTQYHNGTFVSPAGDSHSFCTPSACRKHWAYFGKLKLLATIGGHQWYG